MTWCSSNITCIARTHMFSRDIPRSNCKSRPATAKLRIRPERLRLLLQRISVNDECQCCRPEHTVNRCHDPEILICQRAYEVNEGCRQYDPEHADCRVMFSVTPCHELRHPVCQQKPEEHQSPYHLSRPSLAVLIRILSTGAEPKQKLPGDSKTPD